MFYTTKSCFAFLLILLIGKTTPIQNLIKQVEPIHEYNSTNKTSFYYYAPKVPNMRKSNDDTIIQKKSKILGDNLSGASPSDKNETEEFVSYLATLRYLPVVMVMDDTCKAHPNATYFTNCILIKANIPNEFWLMKFNTSGYTVNLLNLTSVQRLSLGAVNVNTHVQGNWTHVQFNMKKVTAIPFIGTWQIKIKDLANHNIGYNITDYAETELAASSELVKYKQTDEAVSSLPYVNQNKQIRDLPLITIESSVRSNLIATTGSNQKVVFEVTNNIDRPLLVPFSVQDEKSMLRELIPRSTLIPPKSSVEVTVYTIIPSTSSLQYTNLITLTAYGQVRAQKSALLYVNSMKSRELDTTLPYLNYKFVSTCMEVPHSSCNSGIWSIEVMAQDSESGLLRIISEPAGLYSRNGYISGTKETVMQYYSSNCCQPYLEITAIDLNNNKRTYKADAYNASLSTGSIVAITLGVLLLIIIVIVIAILIRKYCKQRDSLDLPRYRGQTASRF